MPTIYNKVVLDGTTLMDISDTTATASDVASGKYFYLATGEKMAGIASGGGGGLETENVIPSQSVDCSISLGDGSYGGLISNQTEYPTDEIYYLVTFDGVDYIARGHDVSSSIIVIGDYNATTSNTYLEFPFAVIYQGESLFYLAVQGSGTHTLEVDKILSFSDSGSDYTRTVIAEEQTTTPVSTSSNDSTYYSATLNVSEGFEAGAEYIITFNGTEYFFTCQVLWGTNYLLGEINYFYGGSDFPYPFGIIWVSGTTCTLARDNGNQVTVKIEKLELTGSGGGGSSATLVTKTITQNGTYDAEDDSADGYSSVTVNVSGGGTPSQTQHTIYFEFSDSTDTTITAYYDSTFISDAITATTPTTYGGKTVTLAQLDGVTWYEYDETWETLYDGYMNWFREDSGNYPYCWISDLGSTPITVGSVYRVTYDNVEYRCTAKTVSLSGNTYTVFGNPVWAGGTDDGSGVPFIFIDYTHYSSWSGGLNVPNFNNSYYFKIEHLVTS